MDLPAQPPRIESRTKKVKGIKSTDLPIMFVARVFLSAYLLSVLFTVVVVLHLFLALVILAFLHTFSPTRTLITPSLRPFM